MPVDRDPVFTYTPLLDAKQAMIGLRLGVHPGADGDAARVAQALNAVGDVWPEGGVPMHIALRGMAAGPGLAEWHAPKGAVLELAPTDADLGWLAGMNGHRPAVCGALDTVAETDMIAVPMAVLKATPGIAEQRLNKRDWIALDGDDRETFDLSVKHGARAVAGWAFMKELPKVGKDPLGSATALLSALDLLNRDADLDEVEAVLRRDAVLAYRLVALVNAASFGLAVEIKSCRHAIAILGVKALKRWLATLLATCGPSDNPPAWLQLSLMRAMFLERLSAHLGEGWSADDLFLCGAFSLLDRILRTPFEDIFAQIAVNEAIRDALVDRTGPLLPLMDVVYSLERGEQARVREKIDLLALGPRQVNLALIEAFSGSQRVDLH